MESKAFLIPAINPGINKIRILHSSLALFTFHSLSIRVPFSVVRTPFFFFPLNSFLFTLNFFYHYLRKSAQSASSACYSLSPLQIRQFPHVNMGVPVIPGGSPVVEVISELGVPAEHQVRLQPGAGETVVSARPLVSS